MDSWKLIKLLGSPLVILHVLHEEEVIIPWENVESAIGELCIIGAWNNDKGVLGRPDYKKQWEDNYGNSSTA